LWRFSHELAEKLGGFSLLDVHSPPVTSASTDISPYMPGSIGAAVIMMMYAIKQCFSRFRERGGAKQKEDK
jgi:hypothetical protein